MKTHVDCFPCIINQTLEAAQKNALPDDRKRSVVYDVLDMLRNLPEETSPPEVSYRMHQLIGKSLGNPDPYEAARREANIRALELVPEIRKKIQKSSDPLEMAVRYAIAGQIFDGEMGDGKSEIQRELEYAPTAVFGSKDVNTLKTQLYNARKVVYLANAAGEIVFDKLLIEVLREMFSAEIALVVKKDPVLTDATLDDASFVGIEPMVHLVANTSDAHTTILGEVNSEIRQLVDNADVIIAKGQTHYESLNQEPLNLFFLFQVNCPVISQEVASEMHQYVAMRSRAVK